VTGAIPADLRNGPYEASYAVRDRARRRHRLRARLDRAVAQADGFDTEGIDISLEQAALAHAAGVATFDDATVALAPDGTFVGRAPNAASPLRGHIRKGDFTHQRSSTARSIRQPDGAADFDFVPARSSSSVSHGLTSAVRGTVWQPINGSPQDHPGRRDRNAT
jgi:hypothetical protein